MTPVSEDLLFAVILFTNLGFALVWTVKFYQIVRSMFREQYPKLYVAVCLCCRLDKLQRENFQFQQEAKMEEILENIEEIQFCNLFLEMTHLVLKEMKGMYQQKQYYAGHD